jgi:peroxiredoxin
LYNEILPEFKKFIGEILGLSFDGIWSHLAFDMVRMISFTLLSDFEPKGAVSLKYGAYKQPTGECSRALFVIDEKGIIQWSHLSPDGVNPGAYGILSALENLHKGKEATKKKEEEKELMA